MMKNFATKPAVKTVFLLAGLCLALFMAVQWIFALGNPGPVSWAIAGMIAITLLTLFLGIAPLNKLSPVAGYVTAAALAVVVLIFVFNIHEYISIGILYLIYATPGLWPFMGEKIEQ
ncbi:hypothetical protein ACXO4A_07175 [Lactobacillus delbrueckii subsp. bulgaricus]